MTETRRKKSRHMSDAGRETKSSLIQTKLQFKPIPKAEKSIEKEEKNKAQFETQVLIDDSCHDMPDHVDRIISEPLSDENNFSTGEFDEPTKSYIEQMQIIIESALSEELHLFNEQHLETFSSYQGLSDDAKLVYFRLLNRKVKRLRTSQMKDSEGVQYSNSIWSELVDSNLVYRGGPPDDDLVSWLQLLSRDELVTICKRYQVQTNGVRMDQLIRSLSEHVTNTCGAFSNNKRIVYTNIMERIQGTIGDLVTIDVSRREHFHRLFVVYFRTTSWPENDQFLLDSILSNASEENVSRRHFVPYKCPRHALIWPLSQALDKYISALQLEQSIHLILQEGTQSIVFQKVIEVWQLAESTPLKAWREAVQDQAEHITGIPMLNCFTEGWVLTRCYEKIAWCLFRLKRHEEAAEGYRELLNQRIFHKARRGAWYDELARIQDVYLGKSLAFKTCEEALADVWVRSGRRHSIVKRLSRLTKSERRVSLALVHEPEIRKRAVPNVSIKAPRYDSHATGQKAVYLDTQGTPMSVEELALKYYSETFGWKGIHAENSIITTLFALSFWDILFDDSVPGAFHHPYQRCPADLHTEFFYESRKGSIHKRLHELECGHFPSIVHRVWDEHCPRRTACIGINWGRFSKEDILEIGECIGGPQIARICELFCKTYWAHGGGVPDLCLWKPADKENGACGQFKLVEVKGEGDRLSDKQIVWQQHLLEFGIQTETFHVYVSSRKKRPQN